MKNIAIIGGVVLVAVAGLWWYVADQKAKDQAMMEEKTMREKQAMEQKIDDEKAMAEKEVMMPKEEAAMMVKTESAASADAMMKPADASLMPKDAMMAQGGQYVPYVASKLAFANEGKVVLFFRASWCPTCKALDADIRAHLDQIPSNVLILDVDYDKYGDLKKQYTVVYQHTFVQVDANGKEITRWGGSPTLAEFLKGVK